MGYFIFSLYYLKRFTFANIRLVDMGKIIRLNKPSRVQIMINNLSTPINS